MIRFSNEDELADVEAVLISIARQLNVELRFKPQVGSLGRDEF